MPDFKITPMDILEPREFVHRSWEDRFGYAVLDIARMVANLKPGERILIERVDENTDGAIFLAHLTQHREEDEDAD